MKTTRTFALLGAMFGVILALAPSLLKADDPEPEVCSPLSPQLCTGTTVQTGYGCNDGNNICCWTKDILRNCSDGTQKSYTFRNKVQPGLCDGTPEDGSGCIAIADEPPGGD